jgi:hypothetical protein
VLPANRPSIPLTRLRCCQQLITAVHCCVYARQLCVSVIVCDCTICQGLIASAKSIHLLGVAGAHAAQQRSKAKWCAVQIRKACAASQRFHCIAECLTQDCYSVPVSCPLGTTFASHAIGYMLLLGASLLSFFFCFITYLLRPQIWRACTMPCKLAVSRETYEFQPDRQSSGLKRQAFFPPSVS